MNRMHAAEDTARIHTELDRLGGKTHLICPTEERSMICVDSERRLRASFAMYGGNPSANGVASAGAGAGAGAGEPAVHPEQIHPTLVQDMRAFDVETFDPATQVKFGLDLPSTIFDPAQPAQAQIDFSFPGFDFSPPAMSVDAGTPMGSGAGTAMAGGSPESWMDAVNSAGAAVAAVAPPSGVGVGVNGHTQAMESMLGSGPPVLDATWQAFVEQLGF